MTHKRILLLGAGGAARGVIYPVLNEMPSELIIANRSVEKAEELARIFSMDKKIRAASFGDLAEPFDIIINATSAGLSGAMPAVPAAIFGKDSLAYDMVYADQPTPFLHFASQHGARIRDGLGMLIEQAAESFFLWRGIRPDTGPVFSALRPA